MGILGGPLAIFFLLALLVTTFGIIFFVALKNAHYYKEDERVNQVGANLFVASSGVGFVVTFLVALVNIPMISELLDWIMLAVFDGNDGFERALILIFLSAILSVVWGIYYAICLRKFKD